MPIHPTAIVHPEAQIDETVEVGPYCVIDAHVRIDAGVRLYHGVYLTGWTRIGEACVIHPQAIVGHEPQDVKYKGERTYCRIGARTVIRENVTIHRGTVPESETVVGEECFLLAGAHVGHNCQIGDGVTLINDVLLAGHVQVASGVTFGGGAVAHQFVRIGELAMLAGRARVTQDVVPFALVDPAGRIAGLNRIGLRRAGFPRDQIDELREAYHILFARGRGVIQGAEALAGRPGSEPVERLVRFVQGESRRGFAGRARRGYAGDPESLE